MQKNLAFLSILPLLFGCGTPKSQSNVLAASFYPISFLLEQIGGAHFEVVTITPPGSEPHDFELTPASVRTLTDARAIFLNGLGMEPWGASLTPSLKEKSYTLSDGLKTLEIEGRVDPHVWLDTTYYSKMAAKVEETLSTIDADHATDFKKNLGTFNQKMADLEDRCRAYAAEFDEKVIAVNHAAYGYFCAEWNIKQLYINSLSPDEEPSQKALQAIIDATKEYGIDTIFFEELSSDKAAKMIAAETGAKVESLNPLESLEEEDVENGEDYFSVYLENMEKIARAKP